MRKTFTRREFLRTTGAAVLAVAAAGALSACGSSGDSYIPNPNPSTAKTLGDLTFDVTGVNFSASGSGTDYTHIHTPILSIKNSSTSEIPLTDITFTMCLPIQMTLQLMQEFTPMRDTKQYFPRFQQVSPLPHMSNSHTTQRKFLPKSPI